MKFDKMCKMILTETYRKGETFIAIVDGAINLVNNISDEDINNITIGKLPINRKYIREVVIRLAEDLPLPEEITRDNTNNQISYEDVIHLIYTHSRITLDTTESQGFLVAKKLFPLLNKNGIIKVLKFKDIKKSEDELDKIEQEMGDASWLANKGNESDDIRDIVKGSLSSREMSGFGKDVYGRDIEDF